MKCNCKIIILTTLIVCALYTTQNLQVSPSTCQKLKSLIRFKNTKKPYFNLSPSPSPSPSPLPLPSHAPSPATHHVRRRNRHHLPPSLSLSERTDDEKGMLVVAVLISASSALFIICLIFLYVGLFKKLTAHRKKKSSLKNAKGKAVSDPPPLPFSKHCSKNEDRSNHLEEDDAKHDQVLTVRNILSNEQVEYHNASSIQYRETLVPPLYHPSSSSTTFLLESSSFSTESDSYSGSNRTHTVKTSPPLPPPVAQGNLPPRLPPCQPTLASNEGTRLSKLKPLHWDNVRAAPDRSMVWDKLKSSSFEFDEELIESLFSYNQHNTNEELQHKSSSPGKHVLESKRLQNLTILLKALNATTEQVCCALVQGSGLNLQQLEILIKMEPTKEEEAKITNYKGDLGSAETFVATILRIPYAFQRIQALLYKETFEDEVTHIRTTFLVLEEACKELRSSQLFLKLLEAVLKMGNRMNVGTIRGGAKAFKLDALLKLADVKGTDGKTTLLHFVVQEIVYSEGVRASESIMGMINQKNNRRNIPDREDDYRNMGLELVGGLSTELCNVKKSATIDFMVVTSSVSNLSQGLARLRTLVNQDLNFGESIKSFLKYAVKQLKELKDHEHKVLELVKQISEYFHGTMSKDDENPLGIFVIVRDFLAMLDRVCRELRRSKGFTHQNLVGSFQ